MTELVKLAPPSAALHAWYAITLSRTLSALPPERLKQAQAEVIAEADFKLDPNDPDVQTARILAAGRQGFSEAELEAIFVDGLKRAPEQHLKRVGPYG